MQPNNQSQIRPGGVYANYRGKIPHMGPPYYFLSLVITSLHIYALVSLEINTFEFALGVIILVDISCWLKAGYVHFFLL